MQAEKSPAILFQKSKKVYRISRFQELFEIETRSRKYIDGPLTFTKNYVGSGEDEISICHIKQLNNIRRDSDRFILFFCFMELKNISANHSIYYRGYLLDGDLTPASRSLIADWLDLDKKTTERVLRKLIKFKLIEHIDFPKIEIPEDDPDSEPENEDFDDLHKTAQNCADLRENAQPFHEGGKGKRKKKGNKKVEKEKEKESTPGNGEYPRKKKSDSSNPKKESRKQSELETSKAPQAKPKGSKGKGKGKTNQKAKDPTQPESQAQSKPEEQPDPKGHDPDPIHPPQTDAGGATLRSSEPTGLVCSDINNRLDDLYNPNAFAAVVFQALGMVNPTSKNGKSELASFASGWQVYLDAGIPPSKLAAEWDKATKKARQISRNRSKCAKPGAVFMGYIKKKQEAIRGSPV